MKLKSTKTFTAFGLSVLAVSLPLCPRSGHGQATWLGEPPPMSIVPTGANAQRNALNNVRSRVDWLQNATRTARGNANTGAQMLWREFQLVRGSYSAFTMTLNAQQAIYGANELAELGAGLDIIAEAFNNYQDDLASGRYPATALADLCRVLQEASAAWLQELNRDCSRLRVGW